MIASAPLLAILVHAPEDAIVPYTAKPVPHVAQDGSKSGRVHLQLDGSATWGIGGQMFLGTQLRFAALFEHWTTMRAIGTWDVGAAFAYQNEPLFFSFAREPGTAGATHRAVLVAQVGHTFHMGKRRRSALGLHVLGGWNYWRSAYSVDYPDEDVSGSAVVARHKPVVGAEVRFVQRLHRRVGLNVVAGTLFPTSSSYVITFGHIGIGLSFFLR